MVSYFPRSGLQRGYLSSYRFMLSFRDIYITLSSLGVLTLALVKQFCRDPCFSPFHFTLFFFSSSPWAERSEPVMIVRLQRARVVIALKQKGLWLGECGWVFTWRGSLWWLARHTFSTNKRRFDYSLIQAYMNTSIQLKKHSKLVSYFAVWLRRRLGGEWTTTWSERKLSQHLTRRSLSFCRLTL